MTETYARIIEIIMCTFTPFLLFNNSVTNSSVDFSDTSMVISNKYSSDSSTVLHLPESLWDVTSWFTSLTVLSPPPAPPLPRVSDSWRLIFLTLSMRGGRGGRAEEGRGAARPDCTPGQRNNTGNKTGRTETKREWEAEELEVQEITTHCNG